MTIIILNWVIEPFRLFDACMVNDGGRAVVITSTERARDLKHRPALIMGMGEHNPSHQVQQAAFLSGPTGAKIAGEMAFGMAGIRLEDIDACEIYDCFTYTVEITMQDYGFFGPGEGEDWFKDGAIEPGGRMPLNTSGGQLSEGLFHGLDSTLGSGHATHGSAAMRGNWDRKQRPKNQNSFSVAITAGYSSPILALF